MPKANSFFNFSAKERMGILVLLSLTILVTAVRYYLRHFVLTRDIPVSYKNEIAALRSFKADSLNTASRAFNAGGDFEDESKPYRPTYTQSNFDNVQPFIFDPNRLDAEGWIRLGLREKTAQTIQNYLAKGGRFRQPEDIRKIWGLHPALADKLLPYVRIKDEEGAGYESATPKTTYKPYERKTVQPVNVNTADTLSLTALPGIGPGYARRIVKFRDALGGFVQVQQVAETFGLPDSVFQKVKPYLLVSGGAKKININTASAKEMKHPYISYQVANAIVAYRNQHGAFRQVSDIKKILIISEEVYNKAMPYLSAD